VFTQLDTNKDGKLQYDELMTGFTEFYGQEFAKDEVDRIFKLVDTDHSNEIDFSEFVIATVQREKILTEDKLRRAFRMFDKDNSGSIDAGEIKKIIGVGKNIDEAVWLEVLAEVDENGDGEVSFEEFQIMMNKLLD
jgi:calcium-dependent protein kinase